MTSLPASSARIVDLRLEGRRDGDVDERDILVVEQVIDAGMDPRHPVASGDRIRPIQVAIDDRDDLQACFSVCGEVGDIDDGTRSDDAQRTPVLGRDRQVARGGDAHQLRQDRTPAKPPLGHAVRAHRPDRVETGDDGPLRPYTRIAVPLLIDRCSSRESSATRAVNAACWRR